jgi:hypothetical protein
MKKAEEVNHNRQMWGLEALFGPNLANYCRRLKRQNARRQELGLDPLPLLLSELERLGGNEVTRFVDTFAPLRRQPFVDISYVTAIGGSGEADFQISPRRR